MVSETMSEESAERGTDRPGSYSIPRIGVDGDGRTHYYADELHRILVYDENGELAHTEDLQGRSLKNWIRFINSSIGWEQAPGHWVDMLADALSREGV